MSIESRTGDVRDAYTKNNALLAYLKSKGHFKPFEGGTVIREEIAYQENSNFEFYSGPDQLAVAAQDNFTSAEFTIRQAACTFMLNGLEEIQNSGKERIINLLDERLGNTEGTFANNMNKAAYSDGTAYGGKQVGGLAVAVSSTPTVGVFGGIDSSLWTFWQNQAVSGAAGWTAANIQANMNALYFKCKRGQDEPDLIIFDNNLFATYLASLQAIQRVTQAEKGDLGFKTLQYMGQDVILDGGIGGFCPANTGFMLNSKYIYWRPYSGRDIKLLDPSGRMPINQDILVKIMVWAGNMTLSYRQVHGTIQP